MEKGPFGGVWDTTAVKTTIQCSSPNGCGERLEGLDFAGWSEEGGKGAAADASERKASYLHVVCYSQLE